MGNSGTATLPSGFRVNTSKTWSSGTTATTQAAGTSGTGALTGTSTGGTYNFANGVTASSTDRALGFLSSSSFSSPRSIIIQCVNSTGSTIDALNIAFDYEKYRAGTRAWSMSLFFSTDGFTWLPAYSGDQSYSADGANAVVNPPTTISKSVNSATGLNIANGATFYFAWDYTGSGGSTNAQGIGIDNVYLFLS